MTRIRSRLAGRYPLIGEVPAACLMLGVEPSAIANQGARQHRRLKPSRWGTATCLSARGLCGNTPASPPMCITKDDADYLPPCSTKSSARSKRRRSDRGPLFLTG
jgi:hypothetical protein